MDQDRQVGIIKELLRQIDDGVNIDAGVQYRMPMDSYVCPDLAVKERRAFFQNHPQLIGLSGDLAEPGSFLTTDDFGTPVLATRDSEGQFHAFLNACRHRGVRVAQDDKGLKHRFVCPFHSWSYNSEGALLSVADESHFGEIDKACNSLIELPAVERDGLLWVHPQPDGDLDIDELLGPLADEIAFHDLGTLVHGGDKRITKNLNWKLANDTFGETYHFGKLHKNTLGRVYLGNNLHFEEFGRNHRFVTASHGIEAVRDLPEHEWDVTKCGFVLYYLFPNIQLIVSSQSCTMVKIYPDPDIVGRSTTKIGVYFSQATIEQALAADPQADPATSDTYGQEAYGSPSLARTMEVFNSTVEQEDYLMGEFQQKTAENGILPEVIFGRNEPPLHHFHRSYREALNLPPLEPVAN